MWDGRWVGPWAADRKLRLSVFWARCPDYREEGSKHPTKVVCFRFASGPPGPLLRRISMGHSLARAARSFPLLLGRPGWTSPHGGSCQPCGAWLPPGGHWAVLLKFVATT